MTTHGEILDILNPIISGGATNARINTAIGKILALLPKDDQTKYTKNGARRIIRFYEKLAHFDGLIKAIKTPPNLGGGPLQSVTFFQRTDCSSGPVVYKPVYQASCAQIEAAILADLQAQRRTVLEEIHLSGFKAD